MKVRAIIFDLYGVLALNGWQAFKMHHFSDRESDWTEVFELGRRVDAGLADYAELIAFTAEKTGETEATVRYKLEHTLLNKPLLHYIVTSLKPHYKLGILSNASSNRVLEQIFTKEQEAIFDVITLSHHVGLTKPEMAMYEAAAARLGVEAAECVFVDDQERHAEGARTAGMQSVVYGGLGQLRSDLQHIFSQSET